MFNIKQKRLEYGLEYMGVKDGKLIIEEGHIFFETDPDGLSQDWAWIHFIFPHVLLRTPVGVKWTKHVSVHVPDKKIYWRDDVTYEQVELGTMEDFKTPEEALRILEKFVGSNTAGKTSGAKEPKAAGRQ